MRFTAENLNEVYTEFTEQGGVTAGEFVAYINAKELVAKPRKPGSGRKDGLTKFKIVEILKTADEGERGFVDKSDASYNYLERIVEKGYLEKVSAPNGNRGRAPVHYVMTGKGRGYLNLSKNWNMGA